MSIEEGGRGAAPQEPIPPAEETAEAREGGQAPAIGPMRMGMVRLQVLQKALALWRAMVVLCCSDGNKNGGCLQVGKLLTSESQKRENCCILRVGSSDTQDLNLSSLRFFLFFFFFFDILFSTIFYLSSCFRAAYFF